MSLFMALETIVARATLSTLCMSKAQVNATLLLRPSCMKSPLLIPCMSMKRPLRRSFTRGPMNMTRAWLLSPTVVILATSASIAFRSLVRPLRSRSRCLVITLTAEFVWNSIVRSFPWDLSMCRALEGRLRLPEPALYAPVSLRGTPWSVFSPWRSSQ